MQSFASTIVVALAIFLFVFFVCTLLDVSTLRFRLVSPYHPPVRRRSFATFGNGFTFRIFNVALHVWRVSHTDRARERGEVFRFFADMTKIARARAGEREISSRFDSDLLSGAVRPTIRLDRDLSTAEVDASVSAEIHHIDVVRRRVDREESERLRDVLAFRRIHERWVKTLTASVDGRFSGVSSPKTRTVA